MLEGRLDSGVKKALGVTLLEVAGVRVEEGVVREDDRSDMWVEHESIVMLGEQLKLSSMSSGGNSSPGERCGEVGTVTTGESGTEGLGDCF